MKKLIALLLVLLMVLSLSACKVTQKQIDSVLDRLDSKNYKSITDSEKERILTTDEFRDAAIIKISEMDSISSLVRFKTCLDAVGYENEMVNAEFKNVIKQYVIDTVESGDIKDCLQAASSLEIYDYFDGDIQTIILNSLEQYQNELFQTKNPESIVTYISDAQYHSDLSFYAPIIDRFPYEELKTIVKEIGRPVSTREGTGYYANKKAEYENESYWYSPLEGKKVSSGGIGCYKFTREYQFYGDFLYRYISKIFWGTSASDYGNETSKELYFQGEQISHSEDAIKQFINDLSSGTGYYIEANSGVFSIVIINTNKITIVDKNKSIFAISYK